MIAELIIIIKSEGPVCKLDRRAINTELLN
jgi:hypothetical protein